MLINFVHRFSPISNVVFTQYGMTNELKEFGQAGVETILKEVIQLHNSVLGFLIVCCRHDIELGKC